MKTMRISTISLAVAGGLFAAAALTAQPATPEAAAASAPPPVAAPAANAGLPTGPGHDTFVRVCSGCHSPEVAAQQRLTPAGWKDIVEQMAANGAVATDAELAEITAYLAKSFPATGP